jgi:hypothetical protein
MQPHAAQCQHLFFRRSKPYPDVHAIAGSGDAHAAQRNANPSDDGEHVFQC